MPDLPYYLPLDPDLATHTALAVVTYDLLLGVLAWTLWHGLLAAPALAFAPAGLRARMSRVRLGLMHRASSVARIAWVVAALTLGRVSTSSGTSSPIPAAGAPSTSRS